MINRYFDEYQLIYRFKKGQYEEVDLTQIESKVDKTMIPVMQLETVNISLSKLIVEVDCLVNSKETILNQTILNHFKLLMTHYDKLGGLVLPQSEQYEITKSSQTRIKLVSVINICIKYAKSVKRIYCL